MIETPQAAEAISQDEELQRRSETAIRIIHSNPDEWDQYLESEAEMRARYDQMIKSGDYDEPAPSWEEYRDNILSYRHHAAQYFHAFQASLYGTLDHSNADTWPLNELHNYLINLVSMLCANYNDWKVPRMANGVSLEKYIRGILDAGTNLFFVRHGGQSDNRAIHLDSPFKKMALMQEELENSPLTYEAILEAAQLKPIFQLIEVLWKQKTGGSISIVSGNNERMTRLARSITEHSRGDPRLNCVRYQSDADLGFIDSPHKNKPVKEVIEKIWRQLAEVTTDKTQREQKMRDELLKRPILDLSEEQRSALAHLFANNGGMEWDGPVDEICGKDAKSRLIADTLSFIKEIPDGSDAVFFVSSTQQGNIVGFDRRLSEAGGVAVYREEPLRAGPELSPFPL